MKENVLTKGSPMFKRLFCRQWALALLLLTMACGGIERYGEAYIYHDYAADEIQVVMPANAPFISAQFRVDDQIQHTGIDIWAKIGTAILAAAPGVITDSYFDPMLGNRISIDHGGDAKGRRIITIYKHMDQRLAKVGDQVARGQQIGTMGSTGLLGAMVHLHFETLRRSRKGGFEYEDPQLHWLNGVGQITCFDSSANYPGTGFATTYPVVCK